MSKELHILILEDVPADAELIERELHKAGVAFVSKRVETREAFQKELTDFVPDIILADYSLPQFDGLSALAIAKEQCPDVPFILVSGAIGEELAIEAIKSGATDYVLKQRLSRLGHTVHRALREVEERAERRRAEEALEQLKRQNELILQSAGEGILGLDLEGKQTFVNPAAARMLGYKTEELIGQPSHMMWHHSKPDGIPYPNEECPINAAYKDGTIHSRDNEVFWRKDGTSFPVRYTSTPIREDDKLIGAVVIFHDITERKKMEKELKGRVIDLEKFYDMAVGRELRMKELKEEITNLKKELAKYKSNENKT